MRQRSPRRWPSVDPADGRASTPWLCKALAATPAWPSARVRAAGSRLALAQAEADRLASDLGLPPREGPPTEDPDVVHEPEAGWGADLRRGPPTAEEMVGVGLGRIVALHHRSSTSSQIH